MNKLKLSIAGSGLGDFVYQNVDFSAATFQKYLSVVSGDGGLEPGKLVFTQELEKYSGKSFKEILKDIVGDRSYDTFNVGGPALVSMINASQLLHDADVEVSFYGARGNDDKGKAITNLLHKLPVDLTHYSVLDGETPFTDVLSDPHYEGGKGERTFVNNIGCAGQFDSSYLDEHFWSSDIIVFGATALVPRLHQELTSLLSKAKRRAAFTVVHTVFDFLNEKRSSKEAWPLGETLESLPLIDLLIMDYVEAQRISGQNNFADICRYYKQNGCNALCITNGAKPTYLYSSGKLFEAVEMPLPICDWISEDFAEHPEKKGDTTGCGDNFAGAVIASIVKQLANGTRPLSLPKAAILGTAAGGFACYSIGGTYYEKQRGEKAAKILEMAQRLAAQHQLDFQ